MRDPVRRRVARWALVPALALGVPGCSTSPELPGATVEYIGHAAVALRSQTGTKVVIDPYNGTKWLGYDFPTEQTADVVLVTHPHYDHDAAYYFDASTLVLREPGVYRVGDLLIRGVEAEHSGGARFRDRGMSPLNVVWVVEAGGVRFAHIGDNALPSAELIAELGPIDVLFTHPFFSPDEVLESYSPADVRVVVPIHYRIPELSHPDFGLPTATEWLGERSPVSTGTSAVTYAPASLPDSVEIHVLEPDAAIAPWSIELMRAWALVDGAATGEDRVRRLREAVALAPDVIQFRVLLAQQLEGRGGDEILRVLEQGLIAGETADPQFKIEARRLLGDGYLERGLTDLATEQFRLALRERRTYAVEAQTAARDALARLGVAER